MQRKTKDTPETRGQKLFESGAVRPVGDGRFEVDSSDPALRGWPYTVSPRTKERPSICDCPDYRRQQFKTPDYRCKHKHAVIAWLNAARTPKPQPPTPKALSIKKSQASMEEMIRISMAKQATALKALSAEDRYWEARHLIDHKRGDAFTKAQAWDSWLEMIDVVIENFEPSEEEAPTDLAFW